MTMPKSKVRYVQGVEPAGDGTLVPVYGSRTVETAATRRYHNCLDRLARLSPCARLVLDFAGERMDPDNLVANNARLRQGLAEVLARAGVAAYSPAAVHKAFAELVGQGLLLRTGRRSIYRINPEYYFKGDERRRLPLLKRLLTP